MKCTLIIIFMGIVITIMKHLLLHLQLKEEGLSDKKLLLASRSQEQLEEIFRRKSSLSLNLKRALPASPGDRSSSSDDMLSSSEMRSCLEEDVMLNRKKKIAAALHVMYPDLPSPIDTTETFHTAAADSPDIRLQFSELECTPNRTASESQATNDNEEESEDPKSDADLDFRTSTDEVPVFHQNNKESEDDSPKVEINTVEANRNEETRLESLDERLLQSSPTMKRLNQRIALQRMLVMKCLEASPPSKDELNRQIAILQDLQKQQIELEVLFLEQERKSQPRNSSESSNENDTASLKFSDSLSEESKDEHKYPQFDTTSIESSALSTVTMKSCTKLKQSEEEEEHSRSLQIVSRVPQGRGYSSVHLTVRTLYEK